MEDDHIYGNKFSLCQDEIVLEIMNVNNENSVGDSLLTDLVRGYPYVYNKSPPNFKDSLMKENSWEEIAKILLDTATECQNRWIRLRERFSKERREIEAELKNGSGVANRQGFILYESMKKFLNSHVQRRK
ncbi:transcription factor Adf-1-like [Pogonomyrmex barbatus]|uniref:Transcription factor Adf-1-like n=1 Tax=Pogonomyrmex barbatus TaxID=144034 RepID=A0A6I9WFG9_9HYME|nr:transcription factor Adf-1-like [Pogonomyrmex barbatus]